MGSATCCGLRAREWAARRSSVSNSRSAAAFRCEPVLRLTGMSQLLGVLHPRTNALHGWLKTAHTIPFILYCQVGTPGGINHKVMDVVWPCNRAREALGWRWSCSPFSRTIALGF